ncbi:hypothetical protein [Sphingobacterium griseoflavum]|uniref:Uncharacterized protein n=1 Tax=Sphingobacterium griseoflavum TaxID=1474952 RepID=A0ABQ3HVC6_9SPHI|nr:hypothetical protein [Sphingobacterium griseoflavum]GHE29758.1 hypothetical protein GCM10017764_10950 [Sphingobacterium griseoflavum]
MADKDAAHGGDGPDFWSEAAHSERLAVDEGFLGVVIEYDECMAEASLPILKSAPEIDAAKDADHIVEARIELKSVSLQVLDCPSSFVTLAIALAKACYRLRVYGYSLGQPQPEGYLRIAIWKADFAPKAVLIQLDSGY